MDKLHAMQVFVRVVEAGSMAAAADALGLSPPAVVRSIAALERALDVRLLHRTTRRMALSDEGREYYGRCRQVLAEVEAAESSLSERRGEPRGRLRITAPVMYGRLHVARTVVDFAARHPSVAIELVLLDRVVDLIEEGFDLALRIGPLPPSTLVARAIGETQRVVCASPQYLKHAGVPRAPADLASHRCIVFTGLAPGEEWSFSGGQRRKVGGNAALRTNQLDVAIDACLAGLGCGQFLSYQVESLLAAGSLRRILEAHEPAPVPIHYVYPSARLLSANVRAFLDLAVRDAPPRRVRRR